MRLKYTLAGGTKYAPYLTTYAPHLLDVIEGNHTLIAGTTGAGKSTLENSIIKALLSVKFAGADDTGRNARFILIDPKKVELRLYRELPHTLLYADEIPTIIDALHSVRQIIDDRFKRMIKEGVRKSKECPIYVFIDELVDLVTCKQAREITRSIADSISIARAANVFFVICTQAPNRKILKPEIVLNCNCRVALRCNDVYESRQIIGDNSAITLPLHGKAIVVKNLERYKIAIPMYTDTELTYLVKAWTDQHKIYNRFKRYMMEKTR